MESGCLISRNWKRFGQKPKRERKNSFNEFFMRGSDKKNFYHSSDRKVSLFLNRCSFASFLIWFNCSIVLSLVSMDTEMNTEIYWYYSKVSISIRSWYVILIYGVIKRNKRLQNNYKYVYNLFLWYQFLNIQDLNKSFSFDFEFEKIFS